MRRVHALVSLSHVWAASDVSCSGRRKKKKEKGKTGRETDTDQGRCGRERHLGWANRFIRPLVIQSGLRSRLWPRRKKEKTKWGGRGKKGGGKRKGTPAFVPATSTWVANSLPFSRSQGKKKGKKGGKGGGRSEGGSRPAGLRLYSSPSSLLLWPKKKTERRGKRGRRKRSHRPPNCFGRPFNSIATKLHHWFARQGGKRRGGRGGEKMRTGVAARGPAARSG